MKVYVRRVFRPVGDDYHDAQLPRIFGYLKIQYHLKIISGLSYFGYRVLDIYQRIVTSMLDVNAVVVPPEYDSHDLAFDNLNVMYRRRPQAGAVL